MSSADLYLWAEEGQPSEVPVAHVVPKAPVDKIYAYSIPDNLQDLVVPGQRVWVPFGRSARLAEAFVLDIGMRAWDNTLRPIADVIDQQSWLDVDLIRLGRWISEYYAAPLGRTLAAMVPAAVRQNRGQLTRRLVRLAAAPRMLGERIAALGPKQRTLIEQFEHAEQEIEAKELCVRAGVSSATLRAALRSGCLIQRQVREPRPPPCFDEPQVTPTFQLNDEQLRASATIEADLDAGGFRVFLLQGVSGSGKTEVYIRAMRRVVDAGRQVILLVPEIALTTQLVHRFVSRFRNVAVLHSGLTEVQRSLTWHAIRAGTLKVIIGTRSAIFAPCCDLGLIVVDEEQDTSYKNQPVPRFHARDVAVFRAQQQGIPAILGSATPALETYYNSLHRDHYRILTLRRRVSGLDMPTVELVDMREDPGAIHGQLLSRLLHARLAAVLERGEQAVLFLNQRGYASALFCPRCRQRVLCPRCRASLVLHKSSNRLRCHHCHTHTAILQTCQDGTCGGRLLAFGMGTERIEIEVLERFPGARVARVDSDSMSDVKSYEKVLGDFAARRLDVMVGTQIVAKGLDFPGVSLVGVISADTALHQPDFRANERTFQLVTQVAGRAGRARHGGRAVVQTIMSDLPALQAAVHHDYERFARIELATRRETGMPPYTRLARWILHDAAESHCAEQGRILAEGVRAAVEACQVSGAEVFGPHACPIERVRDQYRFDVLLRTATVADRQAILAKLRHELKPRLKIGRVTLDVDPVSLL